MPTSIHKDDQSLVHRSWMGGGRAGGQETQSLNGAEDLRQRRHRQQRYSGEIPGQGIKPGWRQGLLPGLRVAPRLLRDRESRESAQEEPRVQQDLVDVLLDHLFRDSG